MRVKYLRVATFVAVAMFATGLTAQTPILNPDPGSSGGSGAGSCQTCIAYGGGSFAGMSCVTPVNGDWGTDACWVESYPEQT